MTADYKPGCPECEREALENLVAAARAAQRTLAEENARLREALTSLSSLVPGFKRFWFDAAGDFHVEHEAVLEYTAPGWNGRVEIK